MFTGKLFFAAPLRMVEDYAILPHDVEFNYEHFRKARHSLDRSAESITCINDTLLSFFA